MLVMSPRRGSSKERCRLAPSGKEVVMKSRLVAWLVMAMVSACVGAAFAGGPVCPPPGCAPVAMCPPPACPPPMCGPPPCPPPCEPGPLAQILRGTVRLVAGIVTLPFRIVDALCDDSYCPPRRRAVVACAPPPPMCPPWQPMPGYANPAFGFGMAPGRPVGFGSGAPRRFVPFNAKKSVKPTKMLAGQVDGIFGAYW